MLVPSGYFPYKVSPRRGLKGLYYEVQMYSPLNAKAITNFNLSKWLLSFAASFKYLGAKLQMSAIRQIEDRGSNILIGNDIWEIVSPLSKLTVNCFKTSTNIPFYLSIASSSVQMRPPLSGIVRPLRISSFSLGNGFSNISLVMYFGGGQCLSKGYLESTKECTPIGRVMDIMKGLS